MNDEDIGWLKAKVETILEYTEKQDVRLAKIENDISLYKTVIKAVKFIGLAAGLVLTFKFGDISNLYQRIFSG